MAMVIGPGLWIASAAPNWGDISEFSLPAAYVASSRCEMLEPEEKEVGAYSLGRLSVLAVLLAALASGLSKYSALLVYKVPRAAE